MSVIESSLPLSAEKRETIRAKLKENASAMTIVIARQLGVPEVEVIREMDSAVELDIARWEQLVRGFEPLENVHVIASNGAVTLECFGQFGNFSFWGDYFNVQTKSLDMHIRFKELSAVFAVEKPGHMDGVPTLSFQFFDARGNGAFKVFLTFGGKVAPPEKQQAFAKLRDEFRLAV